MKKLLLVLLVAFFGFNTAEAQTFNAPAPLEGYAWSPNVGWVSMTGANYGVDINLNGTVTGYAWSPHAGWIRFGGLSGCPTGSCDARIDFASNEFTGWARAIGGRDLAFATPPPPPFNYVEYMRNHCGFSVPNPGSLSLHYVRLQNGGVYDLYDENRASAELRWSCQAGVTPPPNTTGGTPGEPGWDGWISLNANNHGAGFYGLDLSSNGNFSPSSYAWGADVVGWTSFSTAFVDTPCIARSVCTPDGTGVETSTLWCDTSITACGVGESCALVNNRCEPGIDNLTVEPLAVRRGETVDITWETRPGFYSDCRVDGVGGPWTGLQNATGVTSAPMNTARVDFTLTCTVTATGAEILLDTETAFIIAEIFES